MANFRSISEFQNSISDSVSSVVGLDDTELLLNIGIWACSTNVDRPRTVLVTLPNMKSVRQSKSHLESMLPHDGSEQIFNTAIWPVVDYWGAQRYQNPTADIELKLDCLSKIRAGKPLVVFTVATALFHKTIPANDFDESLVKIQVDQELDVDILAENLKSMGYQRTGKVEEKGYFSVRGGLVDIYSPGYRKPIRVELLGDDVTSIRFFSEENQRSLKSLDEIVVGPVSEFILNESQKKEAAQKLHDHLIEIQVEKYERQGILEAFHEGAHFAGYHKLSPLFREANESLITHLKLRDLSQSAYIDLTVAENAAEDISSFFEEVEDYFKDEIENNKLSIDPGLHFYKDLNFEELLSSFTSKIRVGPQQFVEGTNQNTYLPSSTIINKAFLEKYGDKLDLFDEFVNESSGKKMIFLCESKSRFEKLESMFSQRGKRVAKVRSVFELKKILTSEERIILTSAKIEKDLYNSGDELHFIPTSVFWGKLESKSSKEKRLKNYLKSFKDLKENDLVVHVNHGVGKYLSMQSMEIGNQKSEFLIVEYAGGDKVYVPVDKVTLLQRYTPSSSGKSATPLDRLTGSSWEKRKSKVREAVEIMAEELIGIHAKRAIAKSKRYGVAPADFDRFMDDFPFEETPDQLKVIEEIDLDLQSGTPMDRLLIGDVGFGKTEVAMRAAFRAVLEGYQVMVLAPTTVLCYQHFQTFKNRMQKYGVDVRAVNRFVPAKHIKSAKEGWKSGVIDVLVGTHKLLNKQFEPKKLGLLIVDEEQRFGVGHKERIKELKTNAAILTMSATPIPRTLHMSMLGLKNISLLTTPPKNRISVKNFLISFDDQLIRNAVDHEIKRGGQVFVVHNRVEDIAEIGNYISGVCDGVQVKIAHGQMSERELETVIKDFIDNKFPVLVCTTIIESGIDMPNVNTILVNNAHHFGLSQLYQLRGRVGRSGTQAYCYFITPSIDRLSEESRRRIQVIMAHQDLGSGFQIASSDMEIRGAGNVLGEKQSGHVATVGIELYTKMLEDAINKVKGEKVEDVIDPELRLLKSAVIPEHYIEDQSQRLAFYKQLFSIDSEDGIESFKRDIIDQYGEPPEEFGTLFDVAVLKIKLIKLRAGSLAQKGSFSFEVKFLALDEHRISKMLEVVGRDPASYRLLPDYRLRINVDSEGDHETYHKLGFLLEAFCS